MNEPKISKAMAYIDEDLITGAVEYMPHARKRSTYFWKRFVAIAACFCLVVTGSIFFLHQSNQPEDKTDLHEIVQGGTNSEIIQAAGFALFDSVKVEESQLVKKFNTEATLPTYSIASDSVFDTETVNQFAESAAKAGWFTDYTVEYRDGVYSITNKECLSTPVNVNEMGGREIADQFLRDAGITDWLNTQNIVVKFGGLHSDSIPAKYYHLLIDGQYFADGIQLFTDDNGIVLKCNLAIREYKKSEEVVPSLPFVDALTSSFRIPDNRKNTTLKVYGSELSYVAGLPVYVLSGIAEDGNPVTAFAPAYKIDNSQQVTQIYEALK